MRNSFRLSGMSRTGTICPCRWVGEGTNKITFCSHSLQLRKLNSAFHKGGAILQTLAHFLTSNLPNKSLALVATLLQK